MNFPLHQPTPGEFPQSFKKRTTPLAARRFNYSRQIKRTFTAKPRVLRGWGVSLHTKWGVQLPRVANRNIYCQILLPGNMSLQNNASHMFICEAYNKRQTN
jgi:hypothetical protein